MRIADAVQSYVREAQACCLRAARARDGRKVVVDWLKSDLQSIGITATRNDQGDFIKEAVRRFRKALSQDLYEAKLMLARVGDSPNPSLAALDAIKRFSWFAKRDPKHAAKAMYEALSAAVLNGLASSRKLPAVRARVSRVARGHSQPLQAAEASPIFKSPLSFHDASLKVKELLPTSMNSAQLRHLDESIRRMSFFSARVEQAEVLQTMKDALDGIINKTTEGGVTRALSPGEARLAIKEALDEAGYETPGKEGGIEDLRSEARQNLVIKTQTDMAYGFGAHKAGMDPSIIDSWPAWELYRAGFSKEPRDWQMRFEEACDEAGDDQAMNALESEGRMAALKTSEVWDALGNGAGGHDDTLGNPYPPFAFNSGMDLRPLRRDEAEELGLLEPDEEVPGAGAEGEEEDFGEGAEISVGHLDLDIVTSLASLGYNLVNGVLHL